MRQESPALFVYQRKWCVFTDQVIVGRIDIDLMDSGKKTCRRRQIPFVVQLFPRQVLHHQHAPIENLSGVVHETGPGCMTASRQQLQGPVFV